MTTDLKPVPGPDNLPSPATAPQRTQALAVPSAHGLQHPWTTAPQEAGSDEDALDLQDIWRMIVKHKWLITTLAIVGLLAALLLSFLRTPLYLATTSLQIDKRAARVVQYGRDEAPSQDLDERTGLGTQLELLKSRVLAERVIEDLQLDRGGLPMLAPGDVTDAAADATEPNNTLNSGAEGFGGRAAKLWEKAKDGLTKQMEPSLRDGDKLNHEEVVRAFSKTVKVEQLRNTSLLKVSVENPSAELAARIANSMAQSFIALNLERRMDSSSYAKRFLETQLGLTKTRLEESERKLNAFARSRNILTLDEKTSVVNQTFTDFSTAMAKAEQERIKAESEYEAIKSNPDMSRQVLESKTIQAYKEQRSKLDADYQQQSKLFKDEFPRMQQLRAQVVDLDAKIDLEVRSILTSVQSQLATSRRQESLIGTRLAQTRQQILEGQDRSVDFNLLKREVDTNRELYAGLLQQVKEVGVAGGVETNNIQVVDKAVVPLFPFKPQIPLNSAIGLLAGLMLGLLAVFLLESFDDSIKFVDEVEKLLAVPLLGVIPKLKGKTTGSSMALQAHDDPRGHFAEAYRSVRTALQFSTSDGAPRRLLVTSTTKSEGKSTTALALAINFAQLGRQVVLIDADMRNPTSHRYLSVPNVQGLSNYLSGSPLSGSVAGETTIPNLRVVTAGPIPPSPVDLLSGPKLGQLMDLLQSAGAEYIIIDGPPVLGLADAIVLGNQVPAVLYVAQASQTRKSHMKDAFRRLRMAGIVPRGVVLTKTTAQNTAYYAYENYYGYGGSAAPGPTSVHASTGIPGPVKLDPALDPS